MEYTIRPVTQDDWLATEWLAFDAFEDRSRLPGERDEHYLLHRIRESACYVPQLDFVAEESGGQLVGQITYSVAAVHRAGQSLPVLTFGPLSVAPEHQGKGIGAALVHHTLQLARGLCWPAVIIYGHPGYYPRLGFVPAQQFGVLTGQGQTHEALQGVQLTPGVFVNGGWRFVEDELFHTLKREDVDAYTEELLRASDKQ